MDLCMVLGKGATKLSWQAPGVAVRRCQRVCSDPPRLCTNRGSRRVGAGARDRRRHLGVAPRPEQIAIFPACPGLSRAVWDGKDALVSEAQP